MREIKFRGKRLDCGDWIRGYYRETQGYDCESLHLIHCIELGECEDYPVDQKTVGQYTGLNDKNGKEIYEGDVVKKHVHNNYKNGNKTPIYRNYIVKFENLSFRFEALEKEPYYLECGSGELEVIGNIYENPELMGGAE